MRPDGVQASLTPEARLLLAKPLPEQSPCQGKAPAKAPELGCEVWGSSSWGAMETVGEGWESLTPNLRLYSHGWLCSPLPAAPLLALVEVLEPFLKQGVAWLRLVQDWGSGGDREAGPLLSGTHGQADERGCPFWLPHRGQLGQGPVEGCLFFLALLSPPQG